jgi:hypothetical protein
MLPHSAHMSKPRFISAVNFRNKKEQAHAHNKAAKVTGKKRGFSEYVRNYVLADFNKAASR